MHTLSDALHRSLHAHNPTSTSLRCRRLALTPSEWHGHLFEPIPLQVVERVARAHAARLAVAATVAPLTLCELCGGVGGATRQRRRFMHVLTFIFGERCALTLVVARGAGVGAGASGSVVHTVSR